MLFIQRLEVGMDMCESCALREKECDECRVTRRLDAAIAAARGAVAKLEGQVQGDVEEFVRRFDAEKQPRGDTRKMIWLLRSLFADRAESVYVALMADPIGRQILLDVVRGVVVSGDRYRAALRNAVSSLAVTPPPPSDLPAPPRRRPASPGASKG